MTAHALLVRELRKRYGPVEAVAGVSLSVVRGSIHGLLGTNGAGKTTTIEAIVGLVEPDSGEIIVCGLDARADRRGVQRRIGVAMQATAFQDAMTPREVLRTFAALYDVADDPVPVIARFGLTKPDMAYHTLSGGERQRLALALAFLNDPELVILDEPTTGLDPAMRREMHRHVRGLAAEGRAVLVATHDMDEAERLCDRISVLHRGRSVGEGTPQALAATIGAVARVEAELDGTLMADWTIALPGAGDVIATDGRIAFTTPDPDRSLRDLLTLCGALGVRITSVCAGRAALEDMLVALTATDQGQ